MGRGSTKQPRRSYMTCVRLSLPMPPTRRQSTADCCSSCQQALCAPRERKKSIVHCCAIVARGLANGWRAFSHRKSTYGHSLKAHDNNNHSQKGGERKPPPFEFSSLQQALRNGERVLRLCHCLWGKGAPTDRSRRLRYMYHMPRTQRRTGEEARGGCMGYADGACCTLAMS